MTVADFLYGRFKQNCTISGLENSGVFNGCLKYSGTGFGMQSFQRNTEGPQALEQIGEKTLVQRRPQQRSLYNEYRCRVRQLRR